MRANGRDRVLGHHDIEVLLLAEDGPLGARLAGSTAVDRAAILEVATKHLGEVDSDNKGAQNTEAAALFAVRGRWRKHWRIGGELTGRGGLITTPAGIVVQGKRTKLFRSVIYALGCLLGMAATAALVVAPPFVVSIWCLDLARKMGGDPEPILQFGFYLGLNDR